MTIRKFLPLQLLLAACLAAIAPTGCVKDNANKQQPDPIPDQASLNIIKADFDRKVAEMPHGRLFDSCSVKGMSPQERKALMFLYAYMPAGDVTDYGASFYLRNIRTSFKACAEMPWGRNIPANIFRHFVLPVRVNNENLDDSRTAFYNEIRNRVINLSMREAALEVNHWCHEKVIYAPSDSRTSAPLATVKSAVGRCGEESVFTVAALRAVGIPARQVYTPRWAHTDDNHAWVEVWIDGEWFFMGACEPEPTLNMAWFNAPARRSMLMHSKVFGRYATDEETIDLTDCYTEINVTANYAPTSTAAVAVTNPGGTPQPGATVEFKLYNYAEFYTVSRKTTDSRGIASLSAGLGDMIAWASHNGRFGFAKVAPGRQDTVTIELKYTPGDDIDISLDITPPIEGEIPIYATEAQKAANQIRLAQEDSIRNAYSEATFCTAEKASSIAGTNSELAELIAASRANWPELEKPIAASANLAYQLFSAISKKDLRDAAADILLDHLKRSGLDDNFFFRLYILNPRVANEALTPYKSFFQTNIPAQMAEDIRINPEKLVQWTADSIRIVNHLNPQRIPISPAGVWRSRSADAHSRNIFFVAAMRSLHIPARIDPITGKVQYVSDNNWIDVDFETSTAAAPLRGSVTAAYKPIRGIDNPKYYSHFTIAALNADGRPSTLNFESQAQVDMGSGDSWQHLLRAPLNINAGPYILVTGTRMARGNVLAHIRSFNILPGQTTQTTLAMREDPNSVQVIGTIDAETKYVDAETQAETSILAATGRGYFIIGLVGTGQEPTNHALRDIAALAPKFESWGRRIILLFPTESDAKRFNLSDYPRLPSTLVFGYDQSGSISQTLRTAMKWRGSLPAFIIADTFGRIVFYSEGYTIGIGERMLSTIAKL
jgi:hypothetical protein